MEVLPTTGTELYLHKNIYNCSTLTGVG